MFPNTSNPKLPKLEGLEFEGASSHIPADPPATPEQATRGDQGVLGVLGLPKEPSIP